jgi:hypothetical protein
VGVATKDVAADDGAASGARRDPLRVPLKPQYGPTLGQLVAPRWRRARPRTRWLVALGGVAIAGIIIGLVMALEGATISGGARVPFSFSYKGLDRTAPEAGGWARVQRVSDGRLEDSFAVAPLRLPAYSGSVTGEFPLYASGYIRALAAHYPRFALVGEGPVRTSAFGSWEELPPSTIYYHVPTYTIAFTALVGGRPMDGREVWLVPDRRGAREGVDIRMLTAASASGHAISPLSVGTVGVLSRPMRTFSLGG